jgi:hypothetical protein
MVRENAADMGIQMKLTDCSWDLGIDKTDMYRIYASNTVTANVHTFTKSRSELVDYFMNLNNVDIADPVVQSNLNADYNGGIKNVMSSNGIANYEFRLQFRAAALPIINVGTSGGSVTFTTITNGIGYTTSPQVTTEYVRQIRSNWTQQTPLFESSKSGFDDAIIGADSLNGAASAPLDGTSTIFYAGSGYINGTYRVNYFDSFNNSTISVGKEPYGYVVISGGQVVSANVVERSDYTYGTTFTGLPGRRLLFGKIIGGRDRAIITPSVNSETVCTLALTYGGSGYTSVPIVTITGGNEMVFARANAVISGG